VLEDVLPIMTVLFLASQFPPVNTMDRFLNLVIHSLLAMVATTVLVQKEESYALCKLA
jgi:protein tyrosine phosphatase